jgi:hypothetical protein
VGLTTRCFPGEEALYINRKWRPEGVFLDVIGTKILILLLPAIQSHFHQLNLPIS